MMSVVRTGTRQGDEMVVVMVLLKEMGQAHKVVVIHVEVTGQPEEVADVVDWGMYEAVDVQWVKITIEK